MLGEITGLLSRGACQTFKENKSKSCVAEGSGAFE